MCKDIILEMVFYNLPCTDARRNHHVLHLFLLAPLCVRRFVPRGEERGEMAVFTGYLKLQLITQDNARKLVS